ncbi:MAG: hypothetical protein HY088_05030 [Ignavibacteriales bacterium]|nr:hypothetical protein [Ignavibacteriales bacterium]
MKTYPRTIVPLTIVFVIFANCSLHGSEKGTGDHTIAIQSKALNETRDIFVHLPNDYGSADKRYPVLYVLDGEWIFTFAVGAMEFLSGDVSGRMPEMIVVGIPNTNRERDLYYQQEPFSKFIEEELIPSIDSKYQTLPHRVLYGWSSGSVFCLRTFVTKPGLFNNYIASGTGISQQTYDTWKQTLNKNSFRNKRLFANTEGVTPVRVEGLKRLTKLLETTPLDGLKWKCTVMEGENHSAVLAKGLYAGLEFLYSDWTIPIDVAVKGTHAVRDYYTKLSAEYGFNIKIPMGTISEVGFELLYLQKNRIHEAIELLKLNIEEYPESPDVYDGLGDAYEKNNQLELAKINYELACNKAKENSDRHLPAFEEHLKNLQKKLNGKIK